MTANADYPQVPQEVAELWAQLHAEALRRRDDLKPGMNRRLVGLILASALALVVLAGVGAAVAIQQGQQRADATATAVVVNATAARETELAERSAAEARAAAQQTADWITVQARLAETATAQTATAAASATEAAQITATAEASATQAAIATATAIACLQDDLYAAEISTAPTLTPGPGTIWVTSDPLPRIAASWTVINTGQCAWEKLELVPVTGPRTYEVEDISGVVAPGAQFELTIQFTGQPLNPVNAVWSIKANGKDLISRGGKITLEVPTWVVVHTPTPTPRPTPTPTATPTPTPTPRLGNLEALGPKGSHYMRDGVVFEWTYDTELELSYRFEIIAKGPSNTEYKLPVPESCNPYQHQPGNPFRCTVTDGGKLPEDGRYTWRIRVTNQHGDTLRASATLEFDLSRQRSPSTPTPENTPTPEDTPTPTPPRERATPTPTETPKLTQP